MKGRQQAGVLGSVSSKITRTKENETARRKKRGREEKKAMVILLVFIMATLEMHYCRLLDRKGPFGGNVFKNPARYINTYIFSSPENSQSLDCEHAHAVPLLLENL